MPLPSTNRAKKTDGKVSWVSGTSILRGFGKSCSPSPPTLPTPPEGAWEPPAARSWGRGVRGAGALPQTQSPLPASVTKRCAVGIPSVHRRKQSRQFYLFVFFKCQRKKTSIIQGNELEGAASQLQRGHAVCSRQACFFPSAKQLLSFSQGQVLLSHLTHQLDYWEDEQNNEPLAQGLPKAAGTGVHGVSTPLWHWKINLSNENALSQFYSYE